MDGLNTKDIAANLVRRAYKQNISISELCKRTGVNRRWFEYLKKRIPRGVEAYIKIDSYLKQLETNDNNGNNGGEN